MHPNEDGSLFHQLYDDETDIREACLLFNLAEDVDIEQPPSFHLTQTTPDWRDLGFGQRLVMERGSRAEIDVVWHSQPGVRWARLPGNTCRPGDYEIGWVAARLQGRWQDSTSNHFAPSMPPLQWPITAGTDLGTDYEERLRVINQARQQFQIDTRGRAALILMSRADFESLRRQALTDPRNTERLVYERGRGLRGSPRIMGLEVRVEAGLPPGRILVAGDTMPVRPPDSGHTLSVLTMLRGGFQNADGLGQLPAPPTTGKRILPESEVVDEIDRLVNEQLRPGPRDDYHINRYPNCPECHHDWHGLECRHCDCLNTDWLKG